MSSLLHRTTSSSPSPPLKGAAGTLCCLSACLQIISLFPFFNKGAGHFARLAKPSRQRLPELLMWQLLTRCRCPAARCQSTHHPTHICGLKIHREAKAGALRGDGGCRSCSSKVSALWVHLQLSSVLIPQLTAGPCSPYTAAHILPQPPAPLQELKIDKTKGEKPTNELRAPQAKKKL